MEYFFHDRDIITVSKVKSTSLLTDWGHCDLCNPNPYWSLSFYVFTDEVGIWGWLFLQVSADTVKYFWGS